jgi:hypothetical protein
MASRARRIDTRKTFGFLAAWLRLASKVLQQNNRAANSPAGAALVTRDTALKFAWISLALSLTNAAQERRNDWRLV